MVFKKKKPNKYNMKLHKINVKMSGANDEPKITQKINNHLAAIFDSLL